MSKHGKNYRKTSDGKMLVKKKGAPVSQAKAGEILKHGEVKGRPISKKQKKFFGFLRGGKSTRA